jgi:hypothetical protein
MTRFKFVDPQINPHLYHWQRFASEHLETLLRDNIIWFSRPDTFNDPWDCKPCFASNFANDPVEVERHVEDYAEITRQPTAPIAEPLRCEMSDGYGLARIGCDAGGMNNQPREHLLGAEAE